MIWKYGPTLQIGGTLLSQHVDGLCNRLREAPVGVISGGLLREFNPASSAALILAADGGPLTLCGLELGDYDWHATIIPYLEEIQLDYRLSRPLSALCGIKSSVTELCLRCIRYAGNPLNEEGMAPETVTYYWIEGAGAALPVATVKAWATQQSFEELESVSYLAQRAVPSLWLSNERLRR